MRQFQRPLGARIIFSKASCAAVEFRTTLTGFAARDCFLFQCGEEVEIAKVSGCGVNLHGLLSRLVIWQVRFERDSKNFFESVDRLVKMLT
jgi:hypothetical protein